MIRFIIILFIWFSVYADADTFGNWNYFQPAESKFTLIPKDNGLYIQFAGEIELETDIAIQAFGRGNHNVYVILDDDMVDYFPYRKRGTVQKPKLIHLVHSEVLAKEIIANYTGKQLSEDLTIVGRGKVHLKGFNSSADCGSVSYFVFDFKITEFKSNEEFVELAEEGC